MEVTWKSSLSEAEGREYDAFVLASPAGHHAQTRAWADVARAGGNVKARFALVREPAGPSAPGALVGAAMILRACAAGVVLPWAWIERGPVVANVEQVAPVTTAIASAARRRGVAHLGVMPYWTRDAAVLAEQWLHGIGFRDVQQPDGAHVCTLRIAVGGLNDAQLFAGKSKEQVRWRAKQAEKAGARARRGTREDWSTLRALHGAMMRAQGKRESSPAWWAAVQRLAADDSRGSLHVCDHDGRVVAGCVVLRHGPLATYAWGASVADKLPFSKAIPSLVASIRWARDVGCATFDLGGIPAESDTDAKRNAIATFKLDFDKERVRLVHRHARWLV
jgi:lipid II:glycine glycyltransferase (peptidoglycan interpeptide bridge formation enzyme)